MCDEPDCKACRTNDKADEYAAPYVEKLGEVMKEIRNAGNPDGLGPLIQMRALITILAEFLVNTPPHLRAAIVSKTFHELGDKINELSDLPGYAVKVTSEDKIVDLEDLKIFRPTGLPN
jgi:hypothetical protein